MSHMPTFSQPPPGTITGLTFIYTATGSEGASFTVTFPTSRPSTNYLISARGVGLADFLSFDAPTAQYTTTTFRLDCSAAPTAGDKIAITVEDLS